MLSEPFTAWLRVRRQQFHDQLRGVLEPRIALDGEDWHAIEEAAVALLNIDPTHEPACRAFIAARAVRGDYTSALRAYEELWNLLEEEFDAQPSRETQTLIVDIKLGHFADWLAQERAGTARSVSGSRPAPNGSLVDPGSAGGAGAHPRPPSLAEEPAAVPVE